MKPNVFTVPHTCTRLFAEVQKKGELDEEIYTMLSVLS